MPRRCSVCLCKYLKDIDRALEQGEPYRTVAERFSLGSSAVFRHKKEHLSRMNQSQRALSGADIKRLEQRLETAEGRIGFLAKMLLKLSGVPQ